MPSVGARAEPGERSSKGASHFDNVGDAVGLRETIISAEHSRLDRQALFFRWNIETFLRAGSYLLPTDTSVDT